MRYKPWASAVLAAALIHGMPAAAQTFEVASVKPSPDDTPWYYRLNAGGRTVLQGFRLRDLILLAWQTENFRVIGTRGWMDSERFNIEAIGDPGADLDETRLMIRSLLADRFRLRVRRDTRESPVYALILRRRARSYSRRVRANAYRTMVRPPLPRLIRRFHRAVSDPICAIPTTALSSW
jgi:uncharacterized protein (TIGR03435 family)